MKIKVKSIYKKSLKLSAMMLVFVILLASTAPVTAATTPFMDVHSDDFFHDAVAWAFQNRITTGMPEGSNTFVPRGNVTRGQFVTFLYRLEGEPNVGRDIRFSDVSNRNSFFFNAVTWAHGRDIVRGFPDGTFRPNNPIRRQEMVVMLYRYAEYLRADLTSSTSVFNQFEDSGDVESWAAPAMQWAIHRGIITGAYGRILPRNNSTRGQTVTVLHRAVMSGSLSEEPEYEILNYINPLTGLGSARDVSGNRPVAVSLGNAYLDMPINATNGISQADIVYEFLVEYGNTRLFAIYQDFTDVGLVGSIRSVRPYTLDITEAYDALLLHAHGTTLALEQIISREITNFNERGGPRWQIFSRNPNRIPGHTVGYYHSVVTSGPVATRLFPEYRIRLTHRDDFEQELSFADSPSSSRGRIARRVEIRFSPHKTSSFTFSASQNHYYMHQFGSRFTDANNDAPVTFTNLLILRMPISPLEDNRGNPERLDIDTVGTGTGYFVSNGRFVAINWSRECQSSQFIYTLRNGAPVELGRGRTYIGIIPEDSDARFR